MIVLAIDIQHGITNERLYDFDGFLSRVTEILDTARENNVEVIYVQHDDGPGSGFSVGDKDFEIAQQVTPKNEKKYLRKQSTAVLEIRNLPIIWKRMQKEH